MAVAKVGTTGTKSEGLSSATHTLTYSLNGSANFLTVDVTSDPADARTVTGVTWGGVALIEVGTVVENNDGRRLQSFRWDFANGSITTGSQNVVVTFNAATAGATFAVDGWSGVDSTTPVSDIQTIATGVGGDAASPTNIPAVASESGDLVRAAIATAFNTTVTSDGAPQVEDANISDTLFGAGKIATAHEDGAASVTLLWTFTGTINYSAKAYNMNAAASGTTIATPAGSQPFTGRTMGCGLGIGMPDVP